MVVGFGPGRISVASSHSSASDAFHGLVLNLFLVRHSQRRFTSSRWQRRSPLDTSSRIKLVWFGSGTRSVGSLARARSSHVGVWF
jgi:hypothetical protein